MSEQFTAKYFIKKFEAIPEEAWCTECNTNGRGQHCAIGHITARIEEDYNGLPSEVDALTKILGGRDYSIISRINDGKKHGSVHDDVEVFGETPKQRILNALYGKLRSAASLKD